MRRWRYLEDNPAAMNRGWIPPAAECPELGDLRTEHERLLSGFHEANKTLGDLRRAAEADAARRGDALRDAILAGGSPTTTAFPESSVTPDELEEAQQRAEVARDALQQFAERAVETVCELAPHIRAGLANRLRLAEEKRREARELLAEADRLSAEPRRLNNWLARATGDSVLGLFPFEQMDLPTPTPVPELFQEIAGLGLEPDNGEVVGLGSDQPTHEELEAMTHA